jgi:DNA modification methylase
MGLDEVPTMVARGWSEAQKRAYLIADNKLTENGGWDDALLRVELQELEAMGFDALLTGFSAGEIEAMAVDPDALPAGADDIPDAPAEVVTRPGDLWQLGRHRLVCGDCRDPTVVARLVGDRWINLAFTSPPYASQRDYDEASGFRPIPPGEYVEWFAPVAANVASHLAADGSWFVNIKPTSAGLDTELYVFDLVLAHARQWGWHLATEFCWERGGVPKNVSQRFKNQFEPIYQFARGRWKMRPDAVRHESANVPIAGGPGSGDTTWRGNQGHGGTGGAIGYGTAVKQATELKKRRRSGPTMSDHQGTQFQADGMPLGIPNEYIGPGLAYPGNRLPTLSSSHQATGHTAAFPVGLPQFFCLAYSDAGDLVFDPFVGSGSTIMAAAHSKRDGAGCEISPSYCDITVARFHNQFPAEPVTLAGDGRSYDEVAASRTKQTETS